MTANQFERLLKYIDCRIDEKIEDAFGRDTLYKSNDTDIALNGLRFAFNLEVKS